MEGNTMFDVVILQGTKQVLCARLPFLPGAQDQFEFNGTVYIVSKTIYDLSAYQDGSTPAIPAKVYVRRKTDNDY